MTLERTHSGEGLAVEDDWFTIGRWWSEMPSAGPGLKRRVIGRLLRLRGMIQSPKPGRICLMHTGRTGSTVLANMLRAHPELYWDDETLGRRTRWFLNEHPKAYLGPRPAQSPVGEVARRFWRASGCRFGFEVKPMHLMAFGLTDLAANDRPTTARQEKNQRKTKTVKECLK